MAEICIATIARAVNFNGEILLTISSKTVAMAVLASLPILSILNLHSKSLWSAVLEICSGGVGYGGPQTDIGGELIIIKEEDGVDIQCVICLCDVSEGEICRILPECKHGFHVNCLDAWLQSHSTCPLCRCPVPCTSVKSNHEELYLIDTILSYFHSFLDHVCTWFVNPLGFDQLTSTLTEDYRSVL